jgi:hypothetical protein
MHGRRRQKEAHIMYRGSILHASSWRRLALGLCLLVGLCLALGGQARPAHAQSTLINDTFATAPTDLNFNGSAYYDSAAQSGVLTDSFTYDQAGTIFSQSAFTLDAFSSSFQFRTGAGDFGERADGFAFVIQQMGSTAVGGSGAGLGFAGLGGYGAIFRTFNNPECGTGSVGNYAAGKCPEGSTESPPEIEFCLQGSATSRWSASK